MQEPVELLEPTIQQPEMIEAAPPIDTLTDIAGDPVHLAEPSTPEPGTIEPVADMVDAHADLANEPIELVGPSPLEPESFEPLATPIDEQPDLSNELPDLAAPTTPEPEIVEPVAAPVEATVSGLDEPIEMGATIDASSIPSEPETIAVEMSEPPISEPIADPIDLGEDVSLPVFDDSAPPAAPMDDSLTSSGLDKLASEAQMQAPPSLVSDTVLGMSQAEIQAPFVTPNDPTAEPATATDVDALPLISIPSAPIEMESDTQQAVAVALDEPVMQLEADDDAVAPELSPDDTAVMVLAPEEPQPEVAEQTIEEPLILESLSAPTAGPTNSSDEFSGAATIDATSIEPHLAAVEDPIDLGAAPIIDDSVVLDDPPALEPMPAPPEMSSTPLLEPLPVPPALSESVDAEPAVPAIAVETVAIGLPDVPDVEAIVHQPIVHQPIGAQIEATPVEQIESPAIDTLSPESAESFAPQHIASPPVEQPDSVAVEAMTSAGNDSESIAPAFEQTLDLSKLHSVETVSVPLDESAAIDLLNDANDAPATPVVDFSQFAPHPETLVAPDTSEADAPLIVSAQPTAQPVDDLGPGASEDPVDFSFLHNAAVPLSENTAVDMMADEPSAPESTLISSESNEAHHAVIDQSVLETLPHEQIESPEMPEAPHDVAPTMPAAQEFPEILAPVSDDATLPEALITESSAPVPPPPVADAAVNLQTPAGTRRAARASRGSSEMPSARIPMLPSPAWW